MNIFRRELRANRRSLIIWCVIAVLFIATGFSKFTAYEGNPEMLALLDSMPPAMLAMINAEAFNLTTITGFFGVMLVYFALILSIAAVMWGSDIIAKEESDKTVEFALTLPVKRSTLITGKTLAALVNCIILMLVTFGITILSSLRYDTDREFFNFVVLSMVALFIMQLVFLAVGIFLGCAMKQHRRVGTVAVSILLLTYFFSILATLNENFEFLKYLSPFMYFNPATLLHDATIDPVFLLISAGIIAVALAGAYYTYSRRDLYI
jgi:ABC-2 type transport system permease protein